MIKHETIGLILQALQVIVTLCLVLAAIYMVNQIEVVRSDMNNRSGMIIYQLGGPK